MDSKELKKLQMAEAQKRMKALRLLPDCIRYLKKGGVYFSERINGVYNAVLYYENQNRAVERAIERFKEDNPTYMVYHAQLTHAQFGDILSIMFVNDEPSTWENDYNSIIEYGETFVYVVNLDDDWCSEFGTIGIKPSMGGVVRTA